MLKISIYCAVKAKAAISEELSMISYLEEMKFLYRLLMITDYS